MHEQMTVSRIFIFRCRDAGDRSKVVICFFICVIIFHYIWLIWGMRRSDS